LHLSYRNRNFVAYSVNLDKEKINKDAGEGTSSPGDAEGAFCRLTAVAIDTNTLKTDKV
jgi:hypothetical protein